MKKRILVVDDDPCMLELTRALLEHDGYVVATLTGPFGTTRAVGELRPDLVLLDIHMPGLNGDGLVPLLKRDRAGARAKVLLYSASDEDVLERAVVSSGADGYVRKGDDVELRLRVAMYLG